MRKLFNNKYRIPSARLPHWDYAADGAYFITICTQNRVPFFGECKDGKMTLSTVGAIVQGFWYEIPKHFPFVHLGEFVVMPNHIHGIIVLDKTTMIDESVNDAGVLPNVGVETLQCNVSTGTANVNSEFYRKISPKSGSVSAIVRSYKSVCSKHIRLAFPNMNFDWQTRFWDSIIRDDSAFEMISRYIDNNPKNWKEDRFFEVKQSNVYEK